ncbi:hypothetical protein D9757_006156 [Collybiopsis confluens]|uniref:CP-type G domain-containing protein n=1 Tax=Collybiopsis confluens TaxID=2823264 RepID=A0A8H5M7F1_9AGAR|nr:hypothetical protein D9757_006156 [Collybiopsis confluens]
MTMGRTKSRKPAVPIKSKLKKDPGVPKLPSLKQKNEAKHRAKVNLPAHRSDPDSIMASEPTLSSLARMASEAENAYSFSQDGSENQDPSSSTGKTKEQIRKHYLRTLHKVIDEADIIILVLDARDPAGCRSRLVEEEVRRRENEGKKLVFVLNKVDLIPRDNAQSWLKYLRHSTPTLPFRSPSAAQHQRTNISSSTAPALLKLLKAYKPKAGSVTVGVVGYPNVGKSSLINSLKRNKVCAVAAQPGHTKDLQSVQLERGMKIVDSPGVVFDEDDEDFKGQKKGSILLRNVVKVEDVDDPIAVVEEIMLRTEKETLQKIYSLPDYNATLEFLTMLALSSGRLLKGGTPDVITAARQVITDWNHQKIPYSSAPPAIHPSSIPSTISSFSHSGRTPQEPVIAPGAENIGHAQILTEFSKPFELEGLFGTADQKAFGTDSPDVEMDGAADEDGNEMFWDASETLDDEGDIGMHGDDETIPPEELAARRSSLGKRARSPSILSTQAPASRANSDADERTYHYRQPKRQRKSKLIPEYDAPLDAHVLEKMGRSNPMNRQVLKKERKRERKIAKMSQRAGAEHGGMEVDHDSATAHLASTFMA